MFELNELCAIFNVYYFQYEHRPNGEKPEKKSKSKKSKKDKDSDAEEDVVAATTPKSPNKETTGSSSSSSSKRKQASNKKGEDGQQSQSLLEEQQDEVTGYSAERKGWVVLVAVKSLSEWSDPLIYGSLFCLLHCSSVNVSEAESEASNRSSSTTGKDFEMVDSHDVDTS